MIKDTLYYKDNYLTEFTSKVLSCVEENGKIKVVLENTAFYPEGGGQPSDIGTINGVKVIHVEEKDDVIYHIVDNKLEVGQIVECKIDFEHRFSNMQNHSAEHIVSGLICKHYNATNVGFHMGKDTVTMDFNVLLKEDDIRKIEILANEAVYENIEIKADIYTKEEANKLNYRSKKEINEDIRLVEVPGYDICACCGVHVNRTGEIGIIKLLYVEKYKTGCRIYMLVGKKALQNHTETLKIVDDLGALLSLKYNEIYDGVVSLKQEIEVLKKEKNSFKNEIFNIKVKNIEEKDDIILFEEVDSNDMKNLCEKIKVKAKRIAAIFSKNNDMYRFIIMSDNVDLKDIANKFRQELNSKCGGNSNMIQGQVFESKEKILEFFEKI